MRHRWATAPDGGDIESVTIASDRLTATVLTWGACLQDLRLSDSDHGLTAGPATIEGLMGPLSSFGVVVGPVANRIAGARATIDGVSHDLPDNGGGFTLHSGPEGTHRRNWTVTELSSGGVTLALDLPHLACGLPGERRITATFAAAGPTLSLRLAAVTDRPTLMNPANHSYWHLDGDGTPVTDHRLRVAADRRVVLDDALLPTGEVRDVSGDRLDHRALRRFAAGPDARYDLNYCLSESPTEPREVAELVSPGGRRMTVATTQPGLQVFDCGTIDSGGAPTTQGHPIRPFDAVALETQFWPDAPNHPRFPSILLEPGRTWESLTQWSFSTAER